MGPKTEAQVAPSRQFPESAESLEFRYTALLFDHVYSEGFRSRDSLLSSLIRQSGATYGKCLPPACLNYAVAAFSAATLPQKHFQYHVRRNTDAAYRELKTILKRPPEGISEPDLFATFLLGIMATFSPLLSAHLASFTKACFLMLGICLKNQKTPSNRMLNNFGPLILDWLEVLHLRRRNPVKWNETFRLRRDLFSGVSSFEQRLGYFQSECVEWQSDVGRAVKYTVAILADKLVWMIPVIANKEFFSRSEGDEYIEDVFESVNSELRDKQFKDAIAQSELWKEEIPRRCVQR
jgi:hypothetical protein